MISYRSRLDWLKAGVLGRAKVVIDRLYTERHPGRFERWLLRMFAPVIWSMPPNDRWSLGVHAPFWIRRVPVSNELPVERRRRIFMFCAYRGQFTIDLTFAALLLWRGHTVTFAYVPKLRSPIKMPLADHPSAPRYLEDSLAAVEKASGGRLSVVNLATYEDPAAPVDHEFLGRQAISDSVMRLQREMIDPGKPEDAEVIAYYRALGERAQRMAHGFLASRRDQFDLAVIGNGTTFEPANVCNVLLRQGIPLNTYEKFAFRNVRVINHGDDFRSFLDLDLVWNRKDELGYTGAYRDFAVKQARELVDARRRSSKATWAWSLQRSPTQSNLEALREAGVDPNKPFVLVCTNVPYDAGYDKLCTVFPSMREWLVHTVGLLVEQTDLQVVVRAHPGEAAHYGGKERSEDNLAAAGFRPNENLIIIPGDKSVNTYGLMETCKFGIVFSSTTGLEMAMMGKRVVVGADVYYGRRGFTIDAANQEDYARSVLELSRAKGDVSLSVRQSEDAALFHFVLHYAMQWPYPWHKGGDAGTLPPDRLIRTGAIRKYLQMLDVLAMGPDEFRAKAADYLSVHKCHHLPRPPAWDASLNRSVALEQVPVPVQP